jgi:hypothetical protein
MIGLADLADRFILETNAFLESHWDQSRVWWPRKPDGIHAAPPGGNGDSLEGTTVSRVATPGAEELVARLMESCGIVQPQERVAGHPHYAIVFVFDVEQAQGVAGAGHLASRGREAGERMMRPMAVLKAG